MHHLPVAMTLRAFLFLMISALVLPAQTSKGTLKVTFTNETPHEVTFHLNGGDGIDAHLAAGKTQSWDMVIDPGKRPTALIYQSKGQPAQLEVKDGGQYFLRMRKDGKIIGEAK